jgi:hypothetical protein
MSQPKRIVSNLTVGLGNQLFQYATGLGLARAKGCDFAYDIHSAFGCGDEWDELPRYFNVSHRPVPLKELQRESWAFRLPAVGLKAVRKLGKLETFSSFFYLEPGFAFDPALDQRDRSTYLIGYWQSPLYFSKIENEIRREFSFKRPLSERGTELARKIASSTSVSLHVRRGDYLTSHASKVHGSCGIEYYAKALETLASQEGTLDVFVFSDDIKWARENLKFPHAMTFVDHTTGKTADEDMHLMSLCRHNVIANSTFSWWGAWLNANPNKIVVAPARWFADEAMNSQATSLIPSTWLRVGT